MLPVISHHGARPFPPGVAQACHSAETSPPADLLVGQQVRRGSCMDSPDQGPDRGLQRHGAARLRYFRARRQHGHHASRPLPGGGVSLHLRCRPRAGCRMAGAPGGWSVVATRLSSMRQWLLVLRRRAPLHGRSPLHQGFHRKACASCRHAPPAAPSNPSVLGGIPSAPCHHWVVSYVPSSLGSDSISPGGGGGCAPDGPPRDHSSHPMSPAETSSMQPHACTVRK